MFDILQLALCDCGHQYDVTDQLLGRSISSSHLASACYSSLHLAEEYTHASRAGIQHGTPTAYQLLYRPLYRGSAYKT